MFFDFMLNIVSTNKSSCKKWLNLPKKLQIYNQLLLQIKQIPALLMFINFGLFCVNNTYVCVLEFANKFYIKNNQQRSYALKVKKNKSFFLKTIFKLRYHMRFNYFLMRNILKYNPIIRLLKRAASFNVKMSKIYTNLPFVHQHYSSFHSRFRRRWYFITGGLISRFF
jgi:hypothetical protein